MTTSSDNDKPAEKPKPKPKPLTRPVQTGTEQKSGGDSSKGSEKAGTDKKKG